LIPLPGGNVLFVRVTNVGGFKIAGQGHQDGLAWEYANGVWASHGPTYGVSPLIYDNNGVLKFAAVEHGSQGFRYVTPDNRLVTGDQTYGHPTLKLWEYTDLDGILIGQGEGGCHVYIDGVLRQLEPGDTRFIRANRSGDRFAITIVHLDGLFTTLTTLSRADLAALPPVHVDVPAPPPVPAPVPVPPPRWLCPHISLKSNRFVRSIRRPLVQPMRRF
jgi:hypothetical protein